MKAIDPYETLKIEGTLADIGERLTRLFDRHPKMDDLARVERVRLILTALGVNYGA